MKFRIKVKHLPSKAVITGVWASVTVDDMRKFHDTIKKVLLKNYPTLTFKCNEGECVIPLKVLRESVIIFERDEQQEVTSNT